MTSDSGFRIIRPSERPRSAWANGRGSTRALTGDPSGSWRLSIADIGREAPFSTLPGVDRILIVATGEVLLRIDGREHHLVPGVAVDFRGESEASALALTDTAQVVNLMTPRGAAFDGSGAHRLREIPLPQGEDEILILLSPASTVDGIPIEPGTVIVRGSGDTIRAERALTAIFLQFAEPVLHYRLARRSPGKTPPE